MQGAFNLLSIFSKSNSKPSDGDPKVSDEEQDSGNHLGQDIVNMHSNGEKEEKGTKHTSSQSSYEYESDSHSGHLKENLKDVNEDSSAQEQIVAGSPGTMKGKGRIIKELGVDNISRTASNVMTRKMAAETRISSPNNSKENIFVSSKNQPLKVFISKTLKGSDIENKIRKLGGIITKNLHNANLRIGDSSKPLSLFASKGVLSEDYIHDCFEQQKLLPPDSYHLTRKSGIKLGRTAFSVEDDKIMFEYFEKHRKLSNDAIFEILERDWPRHSKTAWRSRLTKTLLKQPRIEKWYKELRQSKRTGKGQKRRNKDAVIVEIETKRKSNKSDSSHPAPNEAEMRTMEENLNTEDSEYQGSTPEDSVTPTANSPVPTTPKQKGLKRVALGNEPICHSTGFVKAKRKMILPFDQSPSGAKSTSRIQKMLHHHENDERIPSSIHLKGVSDSLNEQFLNHPILQLKNSKLITKTNHQNLPNINRSTDLNEEDIQLTVSKMVQEISEPLPTSPKPKQQNEKLSSCGLSPQLREYFKKKISDISRTCKKSKLDVLEALKQTTGHFGDAQNLILFGENGCQYQPWNRNEDEILLSTDSAKISEIRKRKGLAEVNKRMCFLSAWDEL